MKILRSNVQLGDIINTSSITIYVGKYGFTTLDFLTGKESSNSFYTYSDKDRYLNVTRTNLTTFEQITATYPEFFI